MAANRERGEVNVPVEGQDYILSPRFDALCELETLTGKTLDDLFLDIESGRLSGMRACFWCLLQDKHSAEIKTLKDASEWIEKAGGPVVLMAHLATLREWNTETGEAQKKGNPRKARAGTGKRSLKGRSRSA